MRPSGPRAEELFEAEIALDTMSSVKGVINLQLMEFPDDSAPIRGVATREGRYILFVKSLGYGEFFGQGFWARRGMEGDGRVRWMRDLLAGETL